MQQFRAWIRPNFAGADRSAKGATNAVAAADTATSTPPLREALMRHRTSGGSGTPSAAEWGCCARPQSQPALTLVERLGNTRRYRLTPLGLKLGVLLVKLHTRLLSPLATLIGNHTAEPR